MSGHVLMVGCVLDVIRKALAEFEAITSDALSAISTCIGGISVSIKNRHGPRSSREGFWSMLEGMVRGYAV